MGPYDNEKGCHVFVDEIMKGIWIRCNINETLTIMPKINQGFEPFGDEEVIDCVMGISDFLLENMKSGTLEVVPDFLKRFDKNLGYYSA